jgi:iron-sulfur cluster repair protein YtfE (RIC family)
VDSREYGKMEVKIKEMKQRLVTLEEDSPDLYGEYVGKNPLVPTIVDIYEGRQGDLNELRQKATEIRNMRYLSPKDRDSLLKITIMEQNLLKHMMIEDFKAYGMER